jgi:hypothetical protein
MKEDPPNMSAYKSTACGHQIVEDSRCDPAMSGRNTTEVTGFQSDEAHVRKRRPWPIITANSNSWDPLPIAPFRDCFNRGRVAAEMPQADVACFRELTPI